MFEKPKDDSWLFGTREFGTIYFKFKHEDEAYLMSEKISELFGKVYTKRILPQIYMPQIQYGRKLILTLIYIYSSTLICAFYSKSY